MTLKGLLTATTIALASAAIAPAAAHADNWKLCHDGTTDIATVITGETGDIQVWTKPGQACKVAVRAERRLRRDRGTINGWRQLGPLRYEDYAGDDHAVIAVLSKGHTRLKIIQYVGPGW